MCAQFIATIKTPIALSVESLLRQKQKFCLTVTCLEKNESVGRDLFIFFFFFGFCFLFFLTQITEVHILAVIMLHQHQFCDYKGKRGL